MGGDETAETKGVTGPPKLRLCRIDAAYDGPERLVHGRRPQKLVVSSGRSLAAPEARPHDIGPFEREAEKPCHPFRGNRLAGLVFVEGRRAAAENPPRFP